ncbi:hypothetical protein DPMN_158967 [Dreissena polymorpha]|uniref:Uncharacterized protein n=1 Tax=Dreissena polymorpha TaxID=45954 RepID=A0A9D4ENG9_DREPO|nr:hypothetical protein DPMN_158967 [Dreissena polymorpha]
MIVSSARSAKQGTQSHDATYLQLYVQLMWHGHQVLRGVCTDKQRSYGKELSKFSYVKEGPSSTCRLRKILGDHNSNSAVRCSL